MEKMSTRHMTQVSILVAISAIFYYFELPLPGVPLKMDFSDLPVLIGGYMMGPVYGILIALLKNVIHVIAISNNSNLAGELANFSFAVLMMIPVLLAKGKPVVKKITLSAIGLLITVGLMHLINYYVTFPLYGMDKSTAMSQLMAIFLPFNIIKGVILLVIMTIMERYLDKIN